MEFYIEKDKELIRQVVEECDSTFLVGITQRYNYLDILKKMQEFAEIIVVKKGDAIAGYASMYANDFENRTAYISMFGIKKEFQGKGIGKLLMDKCVEAAWQKGMRSIRLEVLKKNGRGNFFYEAYGFKKTRAGTENSIYMSLEL